ncbi:hypothetical protein NGF19_17365 [Streptomyces sp. RY43-2]|uniref:Uncharacterized protein n=1 Tax=Streptomyces macrolidinus TaxID=2952607 RepID=A0ABT0ZG55_9ACTN|nr:hypothetical protein [Streptomyces macrolidinus]MCN9242546.1 hypothetical protein [Streptomyces macrolidinus]
MVSTASASGSITVLAVAGLLALIATTLPGHVALRPRPVTVATAKD